MRIYLSIIILGISSALFSQESVTIPDVSKDLVVFIDSLKVEKDVGDRVSIEELTAFWSEALSVDDSNYSKMLLYDSKAIKSAHGLRFKAYMNKNVEETTDDEELSSYSMRAYAGLEWELLRGGLFNSICNGKKSKLENNVKQIENTKSILSRNRYNAFYLIENTFNSQIKRLLADKLIIDKKLRYMYKLLSYEKRYTSEDVIAKSEDIYSIKNKLYNLYGDEKLIISNKALPYYTIDINAINKYARNSSLDSMLLDNKIKALNTSSYIASNWSLRPNIRYNYIDRINSGDSKFVSYGLSLTVPISIGKNARKSKEYKILKYKGDNQYTINRREQRLQSLISYGIHNQESLLERIKDRKIYEVRMKSINNRNHISPTTTSGIEYLELLSKNIQNEVNILDVNKRLYFNLIEIATSLNGVNPSLFTNELNVCKESGGTNRFIYVWSNTVKQTPASKLVMFLNESDVQNVLISFKDTPDCNKYLNTLEQQDINPCLLIGNNSILNKDSKYIRKYFRDKLKHNVKGINLDIEPHATREWKNKKQEYYKKLIEIYSIAKKECDMANKKLSVSIPFHYDINFLRKIKPLCDKVFVMAYGSSDPNVILKRIKEEVEVFGTDALVIVFNVKDFNRAIQRELVIDAIVDKTNCRNIGYHKASDLYYINNVNH